MPAHPVRVSPDVCGLGGAQEDSARTSKERKACFGDNQPSRSDDGVVLIEKMPSMDAMRQENRRRRMKKTAAQRRGRARDQGEAELGRAESI